ncbi:MAG: hypothetical protein DHS20C05_09390 [Hyphococcus sp.]|nr:MAG: hypothetical protein DHS20C05_09390 [Marinicaulis sp.]
MLFSTTQHAAASDACTTGAIHTEATVSVSNGNQYRTETAFHTRNNAMINFIDDETSMISVEGPLAWSRDQDGDHIADEFMRSFALGHQFHAFILHFGKIATEITATPDIAFQGNSHSGFIGKLPFGGKVSLVGDNWEEPQGYIFKFPNTPAIEVMFFDWRKMENRDLPFHIRIDDQSDVYDYKYSKVEITERTPLWFMNEVAAPDIDAVQIYRLHRKLLAAHCMGDADLMASLTAPETLVASRGDLFHSSDQETRSRFNSVFNRVVYSHYTDLAEPEIEVSSGGDIGWAGVNVRAEGAEVKSGEPFSDQWAWVMLTRKIDGVWYNAGNASNSKDE